MKTEIYRIVRVNEQGQEVGKPRFINLWMKNGYLMIGKSYAINSQLAEFFGYNPKTLKELSQEVLYANYKNCLVKPGDNYLLKVESLKTHNKEKEDSQATLLLQGKEAINFTHQPLAKLGYQISNRLPKEVWQIARPFAKYYSAKDEEFQELVDDMAWGVSAWDLAGWYYTIEAMQVFLKKNYKVSFYGSLINSDALIQPQIDAIRKQMQEKRMRKEVAEKKANEKRASVKAEIREAFKSAECPETKILKESGAIGLAKITAPELGYEGPTIYGGGQWFLIDDEYFYLVRNNGGDGDDWSRSNMSTGGAGAICFRAQRSGKINKLIATISEVDEAFASHLQQ